MLLKKHDIYDICIKLGLDYKKLKYLGSGEFGDAFRADDKVIKITSDPREVKTISSMINKNVNGVVRYYKIIKYNNVHVILMEYVTPLTVYIKKHKPQEFDVINDLIEMVIVDKWNEIKTFEEYKKIVDDTFIYNNNELFYVIMIKMYKLYSKLKQLSSYPDIHIYNIGITKENELALFDYNKL